MGYGYIAEHREAHGETHAIRYTFENVFDLFPGLGGSGGFYAGNFMDIKDVYVTLKRQYKWVLYFGPVRLAGEETKTVTETISQTLTESRSLRALLRVAVKAEANAPFISVSSELTAEVEGTITAQESWAKETVRSVEKKLEPHRFYAFWSLYDRITVTYHLDTLISRCRHLLKDNPNDATAKANIARFEKLNGSPKYFDLIKSRYEDDMEDDKALLDALASS